MKKEKLVTMKEKAAEGVKKFLTRKSSGSVEDETTFSMGKAVAALVVIGLILAFATDFIDVVGENLQSSAVSILGS